MGRVMRSISHSEASTLLDCGLRWDLKYGGRLLDGDTLAPKVVAPRLREGRAWGKAVAAFHKGEDPHVALTLAVSEDADEQMAAGVYFPEVAQVFHARLATILTHYVETVERLALTGLEQEIEVSIPSRTGARKSNKFRYLCFFDGIHTDDSGEWIVEFKLRDNLTALEKIVRDRQIRWYAWAYREQTGIEPVGVIVDERLNRPPVSPKILRSGMPSRDKDQFTTRALWGEAFRGAGGDWNTLKDSDREAIREALDNFDARRWQARHTLFFREDEINEAGHQIVSAARQIALMDAHDLYPTRNPNPSRCGGCEFNDICTTPTDRELIEATFSITTPKSKRLERAA